SKRSDVSDQLSDNLYRDGFQTRHVSTSILMNTSSIDAALNSRIKSSGVPTAKISPSTNSATRSHFSASLITCVVTIRPLPSSANALSCVQTDSLNFGSIPTVGSSSTINTGDPSSVIASDSLRFIPPEN